MITLPPFKSFLASNIPSIYDNTLSYYDELTKLIAYLEQVVVPGINETAGQVDVIKEGLKELKSYVDHYFDNLDVQEEINNKLDDMAEDGTLAEIINQEIFDELNDKIDSAQAEIDEKLVEFPNFYVGSFFHGAMYGREDHEACFYASLNGVDFTEFNKNSDVNEGRSNYLRDMSLQWDGKNHRFLLASVGYSSDRDCLILTSTDFVHWTQHKINLGYMVPHADLHRWAPSLFIDTDGTIYLSISVEHNRVDTRYDTDQILFKCVDDENLLFNRIGKIVLADTSSDSSYIDGSFAKIGNVYYFIVKDEKQDTLELYSTNDIENISGYALIDNQMNFPGLAMEGPCITVSDDVVNIYAEDYGNYHGYGMSQTKKVDFPTHYDNKFTFLESIHFNNSSSTPAKYDGRHGNVIYITDPEAKKIILNNTDISFTNTNAIVRHNETLDFNTFYGYNPSVVIAYPNVIYDLGGMYGDIVIDNLINPYGVTSMIINQSFQYGSLKINKVNGVTANIRYDRRSTQFGDNTTVIDFVGNTAKFRQTQHYASLSDFNNTSEDVTVTRIQGGEFNGCIALDFDITINNVPSGSVTVGTFNEKFRPAIFYQVYSRGLNATIYLSRTGELAADFSGTYQGQVIRCTAVFPPVS